VLILSLDTTTAGGSAALMDDGRLLEEQPGDASRTHGERLPSELLVLLERHGRRLADVDLFAVAAGPGAFTGLRIGIATVQGLALAERRRVVAISALEALAWAVCPPLAREPIADLVVITCMDAQRGEIYAAAYEPPGDAASWRQAGESGGVRELAPPVAASPAALLASWAPLADRPALVVGDGGLTHRAAIQTWNPRATFVEPTPLLAGAIAAMAGPRARAGDAVAPHDIRPLYVRRPDAERDRDRRTAR